MRFRLVALWMALGLVGLAAPAAALTLNVIGGPGLDQGEICADGVLCPGNPTWGLSAAAGVTGSIGYDSGNDTADVTLTLTQDADFGGTVQFLAGTTFAASGIPVMNIPLGGGMFQIVQVGGATGSVSPLTIAAPGGATVLGDTPAVSGLTCVVGTGSDQCGVSFGPGGFSFEAGGTEYNSFVTFNVNVPEPGTLAILAFGISGLALASRRRRA